MSCIFCEIVNKKIPAEVVYEDGFVLAFLDANPKTLGHTLVIPKKHRERLIDLKEEEIHPFFLGLKKVVLLLQEKLSPDGFNIGANQGEHAGQVVPHLHFHILPRFKNDGGGNFQSVVSNPPQITLQEIRKKII